MLGLVPYSGRSTIEPTRCMPRVSLPRPGQRGGFIELYWRGRYVGLGR